MRGEFGQVPTAKILMYSKWIARENLREGSAAGWEMKLLQTPWMDQV